MNFISPFRWPAGGSLLQKWAKISHFSHLIQNIAAEICIQFVSIFLLVDFRSSLGTETSRRSGTRVLSPASPSCEIWGIVFGFLFSIALSVVEGLSGSTLSAHMAYLGSAQVVLEFIHYFSMLVAAMCAVALTYKYIPSQVCISLLRVGSYQLKFALYVHELPSLIFCSQDFQSVWFIYIRLWCYRPIYIHYGTKLVGKWELLSPCHCLLEFGMATT